MGHTITINIDNPKFDEASKEFWDAVVDEAVLAVQLALGIKDRGAELTGKKEENK